MMKDYEEVAREVLHRRDQYVSSRKRKIKQWTLTLTCCCLAALLGFGLWQGGQAVPPVPQQSQGPQVDAVDPGPDPGTVRDDPVIGMQTQPLPVLQLNAARLSNGGTMEIALIMGDFRAMTYEELLGYYGVQLPVQDLFTDLTRTDSAYGIYESGTRGVYFDKNCVIFENRDKTLWLGIGFSRAVHRPNGLSVETPALAFTQINGRQLAVFEYTDVTGSLHYYAEFLQGETGWYVTARGMGQEDFLRLLLAVVAPAEAQEGSAAQAVSGTVCTIDPQAGILGLKMEEGRLGYVLRLPESLAAEDYTLGDWVTVTYTGEPATIQTIWAQQLTDLQPGRN